MNWIQVIGLIATLLVTGSVASFLFQWLKQWVPSNPLLRQVIVWALCLVIALATEWLSGGLLKFLHGTLSAGYILAYGSVIWGIAQGVYNLYWKPKQAAAKNGPA